MSGKTSRSSQEFPHHANNRIRSLRVTEVVKPRLSLIEESKSAVAHLLMQGFRKRYKLHKSH